MTRRQWLGIALLVAAPIVACYGLNQIELALRDNAMQSSGTGQLTESTKRVLDLQSDLTKLFIGFATTVIGGLAYYVKSRQTDFAGSLSPFALAALIASIAACIASIFFGQVWISAVVKELAGHTFDPSNPSWELALPQTGQYLSFIAALLWGSIFIIAQERHRVGNSGAEPIPGSAAAALERSRSDRTSNGQEQGAAICEADAPT